MKVALPIWDGRVSPVFDVAHVLLVAEVDGRSVRSQTIHALTKTDPAARLKEVTDLGVAVLICGAISQALEQLLLSRDVHVIPRKCGDANEILVAYSVARLDEPRYAMPGCQSYRDMPCQRSNHYERSNTVDWACCDQVEIRLDQSSKDDTVNTRCWIAQVGSHRVGELRLEHDQTQGWVRQFDIQPRGQHGPAPCRLIQEALSYCRRRGLIKITVETPIRSRRAMRLFACLGFQRNHRGRRGVRHNPEFYLNLYRAVDETKCIGEINGPAG